MSAVVTAGPPAPAGIAGHAGIPFSRLLRAELRKLTDTRAGKWLLIAMAAITVLVVVVALFATPARDLTYSKLVDYTQTPQKLLLPVLGILAVTSEWSQRTGLVTFTLAPNRGRVLLAKVTATVILGLIVIAIAFAAAAVGNLAGLALRHGNGSWAFGAAGFRDITVVQLTGVIQGIAFGALLLISAAAIVAYYAQNLWTVLLTSVSALKHSAPWIDLNSAQTPLYNHDMTGKGWAQLLVAVAIWVGVPLVLGTIRVRRGEVKSA
jgi:ABC-type transport system involved in multi-copper enzyme maturation permease subunit